MFDVAVKVLEEDWRGGWRWVATQNVDGVYKLVLGVKGGPEAGESMVSNDAALNCSKPSHTNNQYSRAGKELDNENEISFWKCRSPAQTWGRDLTCGKMYKSQ